MAFTIKPGYVTKDLNKYELPRFSISPQKHLLVNLKE